MIPCRVLRNPRTARFGMAEGLVRISAGFEDTEDMIAGLEQALTKV